MNSLADRWFFGWLQALGQLTEFVLEVIRSLFLSRLRVGNLAYNLHFIGIRSQVVVLITGAFTGLVLCAQTFFQFYRIKMETATLAVVSVSMSSELAPVLTGLMVAGRVGASMAAELGTMRVTEQIDALRTLATHPIDYLVVPRVLATLIALPVLTMQSTAVGILSAYWLGTRFLGIDSTYAWAHMVKYTDPADVLTGFVKGIVFGGLLAIIGCFKGLHCPLGAEGVGRATTEAVVYSSIAILVTNFFLTFFLNTVLP